MLRTLGATGARRPTLRAKLFVESLEFRRLLVASDPSAGIPIDDSLSPVVVCPGLDPSLCLSDPIETSVEPDSQDGTTLTGNFDLARALEDDAPSDTLSYRDLRWMLWW